MLFSVSPLKIVAHPWCKTTLTLTLMACALTLIPRFEVAMWGGLSLMTVLPGAQIVRGLGLFRGWRDPRTLILSVALGMVTTPLLIYWLALVLGLNRIVLLGGLPLYIMSMALLNIAYPAHAADDDGDTPRTTLNFAALIIALITALGVFLAYFELETAAGYYPVQMEDWQKHYGVAFALRHTGIPPTSFFFYGMFPDAPLVYYYMLHLNGAALDILQGGASALHGSFVTFIVLASLVFSGSFYLLAEAVFNSRRVATWSLAFATLIGGLDIVPIMQHAIAEYRVNFPTGPLPWELFLPRNHIDNWISALSLRMNTFFAYHIWVPQHLTALSLICLGCYLYLKLPPRRLLLIMPPLLFALVGHSSWVAIIVAVCLILFALHQIFNRWRQAGLSMAGRLFGGYALIAGITLLIGAPFFLTLLGPNAPQSGIALEIPTLDGWWLWHPFQAILGPHALFRLLDLPLHYTLEMGALLLCGLGGLVRAWRSAEFRNPLLPFWGLLLLIGLLIISLFASGRGWAEMGLIQNNDLGLRAMMPGQVVLALFAGYFVVHSGRGLLRGGGLLLLLLMLLGGASSAWEFTAMGLSKYQREPALSPTAYQTLRQLPAVTPPLDKPFPVVQHRIHRTLSRFQLSLGQRPISFSTGEAIVFHREVQALALAHELSQQAFENGLPVWSYQLFHNLGTNYAFVGPAEREPLRHPQKYEHSQYFQPVYEQGEFTVYQVQPLPMGRGSVQATFDEGALQFMGHFFDQTPLYPGDSSLPEEEGRGVVTAWRLTRPVAKNYTVFIHLVDEAGNIVAQADHQLWAWDGRTEGPTAMWRPNLLHLDIYPLPVGAGLSMRLGVWLPKTGAQYPPQAPALPLDEAQRLIIGEAP